MYQTWRCGSLRQGSLSRNEPEMQSDTFFIYFFISHRHYLALLKSIFKSAEYFYRIGRTDGRTCRYLSLPAVTCRYLSLPVVSVNCKINLSGDGVKVACRYLLLPVVTCRYLSLPVVTCRYLSLPVVSVNCKINLSGDGVKVQPRRGRGHDVREVTTYGRESAARYTWVLSACTCRYLSLPVVTCKEESSVAVCNCLQAFALN